MSNYNVSLTLQLKGNGGQELKKISDEQVRAANNINAQWMQIGSAQARFVNTARTGTQVTLNTVKVSDQLLRTHRTVEQVLEQQTKQASIQAKLLAQQI
ncbi:hypothetical protein ACFOGQ_15070 [Acinetobacter vivianii]